MYRRDVLRLAGSACLAGGWPVGAQGRKPNIILILADDLGSGDLGIQGATDIKTPHLDALAKSGMRFERAYSNCPVCSPTRASLLSGRYPELVGVPGVIRLNPADSWGYLSPNATLLPQLMRQAGYRTALCGKWHLGTEPENLPNARGFDRFRGMLGGMMMDYYTHQEHQGPEPDLWRDAQRIQVQGHATDLIANWAAETVEEWGKSSQPFFLYLAFNAPHDPVQPPPDWLRRYQERTPNANEKRARLAALIEHMDDGVGRVLRALQRSGQADNTLVLFTSDNGGRRDLGASNGELRGAKEDVYEGGIRVPLFAAWPGRIAPGTTSDAISLSMDVAVTTAEAAGVRFPGTTDGSSFLPTLLGRPQMLPARDLFWSRREGNARYQGKTIHAARRGDWKLVHNSPFAPMELYNLAHDPRETTNVAGEQKVVFGELAAALRRHLQRSGAVPWQKAETRSTEPFQTTPV